MIIPLLVTIVTLVGINIVYIIKIIKEDREIRVCMNRTDYMLRKIKNDCL